MNGRFEVWLDNQPLTAAVPEIVITDIRDSTPEIDLQTYARARGNGLLVGQRTRQSLSVTVSFYLPIYDTEQRKRAMQDVVTWAKAGGSLSTSDRPDQRLRVQMVEPPVLSSAMRWLQECSITFTAYAFPFWENVTPETVTVASGGSVSHYIPGNADFAPVDAVIQATGSTVTITAGNTFITFEGVSAGTISLSHGEDSILRVESGGVSILSKRTPESFDDLLAVPGENNAFTVTGGSATFSIRGVWES